MHLLSTRGSVLSELIILFEEDLTNFFRHTGPFEIHVYSKEFVDVKAVRVLRECDFLMV